MNDTPLGREGGGGGSRTRAPGTDPLARGVFALLVLACLVAFFVTQRLKHTPTPVQKFKRTPRFSPYPSGHVKDAQISFKLDHTDTVTVTVIDTTGDVVATLAKARPVERYKQFSLRWNGRRGNPAGYGQITTPGGRAILLPRNHGAIAPAGEYRVRVFLRHQHKTVLSPWSLTLVGP